MTPLCRENLGKERKRESDMWESQTRNTSCVAGFVRTSQILSSLSHQDVNTEARGAQSPGLAALALMIPLG